MHFLSLVCFAPGISLMELHIWRGKGVAGIRSMFLRDFSVILFLSTFPIKMGLHLVYEWIGGIGWTEVVVVRTGCFY